VPAFQYSAGVYIGERYFHLIQSRSSSSRIKTDWRKMPYHFEIHFDWTPVIDLANIVINALMPGGEEFSLPIFSMILTLIGAILLGGLIRKRKRK